MTRTATLALASALLLSAAAAFALPPSSVVTGDDPGSGYPEFGQLADAEMVSVTGRGEDCIDNVRTAGVGLIVFGLIGPNHLFIAKGQVTIGLAGLVCAL